MQADTCFPREMQLAASSEGWILSTNESDELQVQRLDEAGIFDCDLDAREYVLRRALRDNCPVARAALEAEALDRLERLKRAHRIERRKEFLSMLAALSISTFIVLLFFFTITKEP